MKQKTYWYLRLLISGLGLGVFSYYLIDPMLGIGWFGGYLLCWFFSYRFVKQGLGEKNE